MIAIETGFYVTGGTLEPDAPSYVERRADSDLFTHLSHGEFCYVLTPRQMGKSSLMARTAARLRAEGAAVVLLELTALGQNLTAEQWYDGLLGTIGQELELEEEVEAFWLAHERLSPLQRWLRALREVVLARYPGRVVICLDEIDTVRSLPFSTDEFFAAIRECYNRRSEDPAFHRLTFCLLGVATPSDLIQDTRTTPFNIGRRIVLADFTDAEAAPLARGLGSSEGVNRALLERILYWTGGHPYLTQRLCQAVAEAIASNPESENHAGAEGVGNRSTGAPKAWGTGAQRRQGAGTEGGGPQLIDRLCGELFLSHGARERDDNLLFVRERLLKSEADLPSLLTLYGQVRSGKRIRYDETNPLVSILRLSGITRIEEPPPFAPSLPRPIPGARPHAFGAPASAQLRVRNRIYAHVFDGEWVAANMPDAELRRQRAAFRKGLVRSAAVACAVVGVVGVLALSAVRERNRLGRLLYVADMNVAQQAVSGGNAERAEELLDAHRPRKRGEGDLRGFEWRYLWRLCQGDALYTFPENAGTVWGVAYSPDGKRLAAVNWDGAIQLWDVATKELATTLQIGPEHRRAHTQSAPLPGRRKGALAISPDGKLLAAAGWDPADPLRGGGINLWDVATARKRNTFSLIPNGPRAFTAEGKVLTALPEPNGWIQTDGLAFSPDGKLLAASGSITAGTLSLGTLKLWDVTAKQEVATFQRPRPLWSVAFSPDGKVLAWVDGEAVELWNVAAKQTAALLPAGKDWVQAVAFSPLGKTLATCSDDQTVRLWDRDTRRVVTTLKGIHWHGRSESCFAFSPNGKKLATVNNTSTSVTLWDLDSREKIATLRGHKKGIFSVAFSPDSETLATGSADGTAKLWSANPTGEGAALGKLGSEALSVAFAPDSQTLATGNADGTLTLWNSASGPPLAALPGHTGSVRSVAYSRDGTLLASGGHDRTVRLWDVASQRTVATLQGHKDEVWCVAFSPDRKSLASGSIDGTVKLWDLATQRETATLQTGAGVVMSLSFAPDGKTLALGTNENSVKLWDLRARQEVASLPGHTSFVTATAFSADGKLLATGSADDTVLLWDVAGRQAMATLKGCQGRVNSVAFSPDGKTVAGGSADSSVRLWNVATGREVGTPRGPQGAVSCVAFSADGSALAAVGKDGAVRLWRAPSFAVTDAQRAAALDGRGRDEARR